MRVLAIGAHPDDVEFLCFGTLARFARDGHSVTIAHACTGDKGHTTILPPELDAIRGQEARDAAALIGAECLSLGCPDGELFLDDATLHRMVDLLRQARPDLIITHTQGDYHSDHNATSRLVTDASGLANVPHYFTALPAYPVNPTLYYMDSIGGVGFLPTDYVDITETFALKREALACHKSQHGWLLEHHAMDAFDTLDVHARFRGVQCGVRYAEAFRPLHTSGRVLPRRQLP